MRRRKMNNLRIFSILIIGIIVLTAAINLLSVVLLGSVGIDTTFDKRYSFSTKTEEFLKKSNIPVSIRLYVSDNLHKNNPKLGKYADYVYRILQEYERKSKGKVELTVVTVLPFSNSQAEAEKAGVKEFDYGDGKKFLYLGAAFSNVYGKNSVIEQFWPQRKDWLEDDITRKLSILQNDKKIRLGVLSSFFNVVDNGSGILPFENWSFVKRLKEDGFDVVGLRDTLSVIDDNIDAVLVFYPLNLNKTVVYAIDQYLVRGGKVIVALDNFAEERFVGQEHYFSYSSGLRNFLDVNGVGYVENVLVGDNVNNRNIVLDGQLTQYPFYLTLSGNLIKKHIINEGIDSLFLNHSGFFEIDKKTNLAVSVLAETSSDSGVMLAKEIADLSFDNLLKSYQRSDEKYPLIVLLEGLFSSSFERPLVFNGEILKKQPMFMSKAKQDGKLLLISDIDMFGEKLWKENKGDEDATMDAFYSDNMRFLRNVVDYMTQSNLVGVPKKAIGKGRQNLAAIFYKWADAFYAEQKRKAADRMVGLKRTIIAFQEKQQGVNLQSVKSLKNLEQLRRETAMAEQNLRKISYKIGKLYEFIFLLFSGIMVFGFPLVAVLISWFIYQIYSGKIKGKAQGVVDE